MRKLNSFTPMPSEKKILFISSWNPTKESPHDGLFIRRHAQALQAVGEQILYIEINIEQASSLFTITNTRNTKNELDTISISVGSIFWKFIYVLYPVLKWLFVNPILKSVSDDNIGITLSNVLHPTSVVGAAIAKKLHTPHVIIEHFSKTRFYFQHQLFRRTLKRIFREADLVIPISGYLKSIIHSEVPEAKIQVIPNVVPSDQFQFLEKKQSATLKFLAVANWHRISRDIKRPDLIIEALGSLQALRPDLTVELEFIGGGNMLPAMKESCTIHQINASFPGSQDSTYIAQALQSTDYFLHASNIETFSVVIVEALSCGVPVLASHVGAIPDLINDDNGLLTNNTAQDWSDGLSKLIDQSFNRELIAQSVKHKYDSITIGKKLSNALSDL